jgi:hypothetical protein
LGAKCRQTTDVGAFWGQNAGRRRRLGPTARMVTWGPAPAELWAPMSSQPSAGPQISCSSQPSSGPIKFPAKLWAPCVPSPCMQFWAPDLSFHPSSGPHIQVPSQALCAPAKLWAPRSKFPSELWVPDPRVPSPCNPVPYVIPSWPHLGPMLSHLGPMLSHLCPMLSHFGCMLSHLGPMLSHLGPICYPKGLKVCFFAATRRRFGSLCIYIYYILRLQHAGLRRGSEIEVSIPNA